MSGPKICFVGAGSVEFTGMLIADILAYDDLREVTISLHDIDSERLQTAEGVARAIADQRGAPPRSSPISSAVRRSTAPTTRST